MSESAELSILEVRTDGKIVVELIYHGKDSVENQHCSIRITVNGAPDESFTIFPDDDKVMDAFHHPYAYAKDIHATA